MSRGRSLRSKVIVLASAMLGGAWVALPAVGVAADEVLLAPVSSTQVAVSRDATSLWLPFRAAAGVDAGDLRAVVGYLKQADSTLLTEGVSATIVPTGTEPAADLPCPALPASFRRFDLLCVAFPPFAGDGSYELLLTVDGTSPATGSTVIQNLVLTLVRSAAVITTSAPAIFVREQVSPFSADLVAHEPFSIELKEIGRLSPITGIIVSQEGEAKVGSEPIGGKLRVQPPERVVQGSYSHAKVEFEGDWPPGNATAMLTVSAPELAADIRVPVVVQTRVSLFWMFGVALLGVVCGAALRGVAQNGRTGLRQGTRAEKLRRFAGFAARTIAAVLLFEVIVYVLHGATWKGTLNDVAVVFLWAVTVDFTAEGLLGLAKKHGSSPAPA